MRTIKKVLVYLLLTITMSIGLGCGQVVKAQAKPKQSLLKYLYKQMKSFLPIMGGAAIYYVTHKELMEEFRNTPNNRDTIYSSFYNNTTNNINIDITTDGKNWERRSIEPNDKIEVTSGDKGLIGLRDKDRFIINEESGKYHVVDENGETVIMEK